MPSEVRHRHRHRLLADEADGDEIADEIVRVILGDLRQRDEARRQRKQKRVAVVGRGARDLHADRARGARMVGDEHLLVPMLRQSLGDDARDDVRRPARSGGDDEFHGRVGEALRLCTRYNQRSKHQRNNDSPDRPHPEEPAEGWRLEGWGRPRRASALIRLQSLPMSASFFARVHPFTCRSAAIASVKASKCCEKTSSTGRRVAVYPPNCPALCSAMRFSKPSRAVPT